MHQIKQHGVKVIWNKIEDEVMTKFNEFSSFYQTKENRNLQALVQAGQYTVLDNELDVFQRKINNSKGYQQYCSLILQQASLFSNSFRQERASSNLKEQFKLNKQPLSDKNLQQEKIAKAMHIYR